MTSRQVNPKEDFQIALREIELLFDSASASLELTELDAVSANGEVAQTANMSIDTNVQNEPTEV